jgi:hypothetical protein
MSTEGPTDTPTQPERRTLWLSVGHVIVGVTTALVTQFVGHFSMEWGYAFVGLIFGQSSLLGIWCGLGTSPWWVRTIGGMIGIGCLSLLLSLGVDEWDLTIPLVVAMAASVVVFVLLIVRGFRVVIHQMSQPIVTTTRVQFSIRHLMILTLVIACLVSIGRFLQPFLPHGDVWFRLLLFAVTGGVVGILPVWFVLATTRPVPYGVGVVAAGAFAGYWIGQFDMFHEGIWMTLTTSEALAVVVSLLIVRSCGYRLVRLSPRLLKKA